MSEAVNDLIKAVKKKEVQKQGKPSDAKRALDLVEMKQVLTLLVSFPKENYATHLGGVCKIHDSHHWAS
jgi:hypothetical protein